MARGSSAQGFSFSACEVGTKASVADLYRDRVAGRAADGDGRHCGRPGWRGLPLLSARLHDARPVGV